MLVLARQKNQTIVIGEDIEITIVDVRGDKVRLGITAPRQISVHRKEVYEAVKRKKQAAAAPPAVAQCDNGNAHQQDLSEVRNPCTDQAGVVT